MERIVQIHAQVLEHCVQVQLPEARFEARLELLHELPVPVDEACSPTLDNLTFRSKARVHQHLKDIVLFVSRNHGLEKIHRALGKI